MSTARDAITARKHLDALLFVAQKTKSNLMEAVGTDRAGCFVLESLQPWLFEPKREFVSRLYDRLQDPRPIDPTEYRNFFVLVFMFVPIVTLGFPLWGRYDMPKSEDDLIVAFDWPEEAQRGA